MKDIISSLGHFLRAMVAFFGKIKGKLFKDKKDFVKFMMIWATALVLWWIIRANNRQTFFQTYLGILIQAPLK